MSGGMQRAQHADHGEDREPQNNLDQCIARDGAKRILPRLLGRKGQRRRQDEAVGRRESPHRGEGNKLEQRRLSAG